MTQRAENPVFDLAELFVSDLRPAVGDTSIKEIALQLRFGEVELVDGEVLFTVSMQRAYVGLDPVGVAIDPSGRYGEVAKENEVVAERKREEKKVTSLKARANAAFKTVIPSLGLDAEAGAAAEKSTSETKVISDKERSTRVTPRGGEKWEIIEPEGKVLDGLYLDKTKALCRLIPKKGANRRSVTAQVYVKQRDLIFKRDGESLFRRKLTKNEERMLGILIAKALKQQSLAPGSKKNGYIVLSEAEIEYED